MAGSEYLAYGLTSPEGSKWTWDEFAKDYKEHHMPTALTAPGWSTGLHYKNVESEAQWPHLALYTFSDLSSLASPVFQKLTKGSQEAQIKVAVRIYQKVQDFEGQNEVTGNHGKIALVTQIKAKPGLENELDEFARKQHLDMYSMVRGYRRSTRWEILPENDENGKLPESQSKLLPIMAIHEFDEPPPEDQIRLLRGTEWAKRVRAEACQDMTLSVWELIDEQGEGLKL